MHRFSGIRYRLLLVTVVLQLTVLGLELPAPWTDLADIAFAMVLAGLLYVVRGSLSEGIVLAALAVIAPVFNLFIPLGELLWLDLIKVGFWTLAPAYLAWKLFDTIYEEEIVSQEEILAAIALYLLLGLVFASLYEGILLLDPGALQFGSHFAGEDIGFAEILYFSYVTLATLGYGDVSPVHPLARTVAVAESVVGVMYVAILIARFVGLGTRRR